MMFGEKSEIFVPDGTEQNLALTRTTHMAIAAHQDDIELMAYDGILKCFGKENQWFTGVVVTDGAGSPRSGIYEKYSDEDMKKIRILEQKKAAYIGEYSAAVLLGFSSSRVKDSKEIAPVVSIKDIIAICRPKVIYTHNLADKHDTHVGVAIKVIRAIRELPETARPEKLFGCEVWRDLDWLNDNQKVVFDVSQYPNLAASLIGVYDSQISGGKRYDLAMQGRRIANATYSASHGTDEATGLIYAMDLTPLIIDVELDIQEFINSYIIKFAADVAARIKKVTV